jgi:fatty acid desaturase
MTTNPSIDDLDAWGEQAISIDRESIPIEYFQKSDSYGWVVTARILGSFFGSILLTPVVFSYSAWSLLITVPLLGWAAYKIQFILHDASHKTLFNTRALNEAVGTFSGLLIGVYLKMYRYTHMQHHRLNGEPEDPQYPDYLGGGELSAWEYFRFIASPLFGGRILPYLAREFGPTLFKGSPRASELNRKGPVITSAWLISLVAIHAVLATIVTGFWKFPLLALALPFSEATVSLFLARVRALAEHQKCQCEGTHDFSRSHLPTVLDKILLYDANFNYHLEHHVEPAIPSKNLPAFYATHTKTIHTSDTLGKGMFGTLYHIFKSRPS